MLLGCRRKPSHSREHGIIVHAHPHELGTGIRRGDIRAFEQLFRELHAPLCEVVDGYVRSQSIAEELVQDLFLRVTAVYSNPSLMGVIGALAASVGARYERSGRTITLSGGSRATK